MSYSPRSQQSERRPRRRNVSGLKLRLLMAAGIILFSCVSYFSTTSKNPVTGEDQRVAMTAEQEIQLGRDAAFQMIQQHGGRSSDPRATHHVELVGKRLENALYHQLQKKGVSMPYPFDFHLLADNQVINAFALPGGQVFMTEALYRRMTHEGQLAGVLGHEIGHVIERHGAARMAQGGFFQKIAGAAGVAAGDTNSVRAASMFLDVLGKGYGRQAELESDRWGVELMAMSGYNPTHMLEVMNILKEASAGGNAPPEFLSSHPKPENRQRYIRDVIAEKFPQGLPPGLQ